MWTEGRTIVGGTGIFGVLRLRSSMTPTNFAQGNDTEGREREKKAEADSLLE
jgi:hypothetical protein